jgi:hypothetical protein
MVMMIVPATLTNDLATLGTNAFANCNTNRAIILIMVNFIVVVVDVCTTNIITANTKINTNSTNNTITINVDIISYIN